MAHSGTNRKRESVIDENLRRVYDATLDEGVPDRFQELLKALQEQEKDQSGGQSR